VTGDLAVWLFTIAAAFAGGAVLTGAWRREQCGQAEAAAEMHRGHAAELGVELAHMRRARDEARERCDTQEARAWEAESAAHHLAQRNAELARHERDAHNRLFPALGLGDDSRLPAPLDAGLDLRAGAPAVSMFMSNDEWRRLAEGDPDVPVLPARMPSRRELEPAP
jgi:hypothetical protein